MKTEHPSHSFQPIEHVDQPHTHLEKKVKKRRLANFARKWAEKISTFLKRHRGSRQKGFTG